MVEETPARLVLRQGAGPAPLVIFLIVLAVFLAGFILIGLAPGTGMPIVLSVGGALMALFALAWGYILALATHTTEITFDRRADSIAFRHRALLRARHARMALSEVTGVAVERHEREFRQKDASGKHKPVTDICYRPLLLTAAAPVPLFTTYTNQATATAPARAVLHWLLGEASAEPPVLDSTSLRA